MATKPKAKQKAKPAPKKKGMDISAKGTMQKIKERKNILYDT